MAVPDIFIIGEHKADLAGLRQILLAHGFNAIEAETNDQVLQILRKQKPDLVIICSSSIKPEKALKLIRMIRRENCEIPIIFNTQYSSESLAIAALKAHVNDYFKAPFSSRKLLQSIERHLAPSDFDDINDSKASSNTFQPMIGRSNKMHDVKAYLHKLAGTDSTVLITGETGTGKELAARMIHNQSLRGNHPLVCINCSALPETLLESELFGFEKGAFTGAVAARSGKFLLAANGTVFLDEIGDMSPCSQAKILRCLECREATPLGGNRALPLNIRVIAATNHSLEESIAAGRFREDLYYRLNIGRIHLPPLRERKEDIPDLIAHGIRMMNHHFNRQVLGLTQSAEEMVMRHDWPGNIRELLNLLEATFISLNHDKIDFADLPPMFRKRFEASEKRPVEERQQIVSALLDTRWNKSETARKLQWSRMTVYRKMARYQIVENRYPQR